MIEQVRMVTVRNTVAQYVGLTLADGAYRRQFKGKNAKMIIPFDMLETALAYDEGVQYLFNTGMLYIDSMQDKIDLGLEEPDTTTPTNIVVFSDEEKVKLLTTASVPDFIERLSRVTYEEAAELAKFAAKNDIYNPEKSDILKEITGLDVVAMIAKKKAFEEADKRAASMKDDREPEGVFKPRR